jgi:hypothetical protein
MRNSENSKLASWVGKQKQQYRLKLEGKNIAYDPLPSPGIGEHRIRMEAMEHYNG